MDASEALARALRAIHGDVVPLPNRPTPAEYAAMIVHWLPDGYEVRPIDGGLTLTGDATGLTLAELNRRADARAEAAEAADREAAGEVWQREATGESPSERPNTNSEPCSPSAAVAPDVDMEGDGWCAQCGKRHGGPCLAVAPQWGPPPACRDSGCKWKAIPHYQHEPNGAIYAIMQPAAADPEALERLAALEHEQWEKWSREVAATGLTPERIERWQRYWVPYAELDEATKEHDRVWARKALSLAADPIRSMREFEGRYSLPCTHADPEAVALLRDAASALSESLWPYGTEGRYWTEPEPVFALRRALARLAALRGSE